MAAYHWVYDSRHLQAYCQELGSAPEPYAWQSSMGYLYLLLFNTALCSVRGGTKTVGTLASQYMSEVCQLFHVSA